MTARKLSEDRRARSRVATGMATFAFASLFALAGCPGRSVEPRTPTSESSGAGEASRGGATRAAATAPGTQVPWGDETALDETPAAAPDEAPAPPEPEPVDEGAPAAEGDAETAADEPIEPPGLDLDPAEAREKVRYHLGRAVEALQGDPQDPDRAIDEARHALQVEENNLQAMLIIAWSNYIKGYHDMAESALDVAAERADGEAHARYHFIAGLVFDATDRPDEAQAAYEQAVELRPGYRNALLNIGVHYLKNKRYPEAIRVYEDLTGELGDQRPASWANLGSAYRGRAAELEGPGGDRQGRDDYIQRARRAYERALELDSNYAPAYYNLGILYLDAEPFPDGGEELATLERLKQAKQHFDRYRGMPGADVARADEQAKLVQDLIAREERREELRQRREERRRQREQRRRDREGEG